MIVLKEKVKSAKKWSVVLHTKDKMCTKLLGCDSHECKKKVWETLFKAILLTPNLFFIKKTNTDCIAS